jgi:3-vinyl bacteriochlorophyllide hydratase
MLRNRVFDRFFSSIDQCPWPTLAGAPEGGVVSVRSAGRSATLPKSKPRPLYSADERRRRDASPWTLVQGLLAPVQFLAFFVSLALIVRYLITGDGLGIAMASVVVKTMLLYAIMITGSIWEQEVFGKYLFAPAFFWEDVVSMLVLALHTAYLGALYFGSLDAHGLMLLALAAYASYVINATQFLLKLRAARLQQNDVTSGTARPFGNVG